MRKAAAVSGAPAEARAARGPARRGERADGRRDQREPAERHPDAGEVAPVRAGVDDVQAVRDDAEAEREQADEQRQREAGRPDESRLGREPRRGDGDDREHAEDRRVRTGERQVEQVRGDERQPARQERALQAGEAGPPPPATARRRGLGTLLLEDDGFHTMRVPGSGARAYGAHRCPGVRSTGGRWCGLSRAQDRR
jgi:hypothetical protein